MDNTVMISHVTLLTYIISHQFSKQLDSSIFDRQRSMIQAG